MLNDKITKGQAFAAIAAAPRMMFGWRRRMQDAIEALQAQPEAQDGEWIDVRDAMPPIDSYVMVTCIATQGIQGGRRGAPYITIAKLREDGLWQRNQCNKKQIVKSEVTGWMHIRRPYLRWEDEA